jgi:hypothetical protein
MKLLGFRTPATVLADRRAARRRRTLRKAQPMAVDAMERTGIVFVHIPKCGGKSILQAIYGLEQHAGFGHADAVFYRTLLGPTLFEDALKLAVIRDPVARCKSGFHFARKGGFGLAKDRELAGKLGAATFDRFVLDGHLERLMSEAVIFRPQHSFLQDSRGSLLIDNLVRLDEAAERLPRIVGDRVAGMTIPHENRSDYDRGAEVDGAVAAAIRDLYADDYRLLGF